MPVLAARQQAEHKEHGSSCQQGRQNTRKCSGQGRGSLQKPPSGGGAAPGGMVSHPTCWPGQDSSSLPTKPQNLLADLEFIRSLEPTAAFDVLQLGTCVMG